MRIEWKNGSLLLRDAAPGTAMQLARIPGLKWYRRNKCFQGVATPELLNQLRRVAGLPPEIEAKRQRILRRRAAIAAERTNPAPVPLVDYPVKVPLYAHQVRGANMALMAFGWR